MLNHTAGVQVIFLTRIHRSLFLCQFAVATKCLQQFSIFFLLIW